MINKNNLSAKSPVQKLTEQLILPAEAELSTTRQQQVLLRINISDWKDLSSQ